MKKLKGDEECLINNSKDNPIDLTIYSYIDFKKYCKNGHKSKKYFFVNICKKCSKKFKKRYCYTYNKFSNSYFYTCPNCIRENTLMKTKGVKNVSQLKEIKEQKKKTTKKHYKVEVPIQSKEIYQKIQQTCEERYGVKNVSQNEEIKRKKEKTCEEHHGKPYYMQTKEYKKVMEETSLKKYGTKYPSQNEEIKRKGQETNKRNHGGKHYSETKAHKEKMQKMLKENHDKIVEKREKTLLEKYGHAFNFVSNNSYLYDNEFFDSSWELAFYIYYKDKGFNIIRNSKDFFEYKINGKIHKYYPDFKIGRKYYEIKGEQFIIRYKNGKVKCLKSITGSIQKEKYNCIKMNKVKLITCIEIKKILHYISEKYDKNYLKTFKIHK